jgi:uncharacterized membrane protein YtjA (UPF0391 family)
MAMLSAVAPVATAQALPLVLSGDFLYYGVVFFVLALVAGLAGFRDVAGLSMSIAKFLVLIFLVLAIVTLVL